MSLRKMVLFVLVAISFSGCASQWKIHGGPKECANMCKNWGMELTGMVGVGSQDSSGPGATACVCEKQNQTGISSGAKGTASGVGAIIAILQEEEARRRQQQNL